MKMGMSAAEAKRRIGANEFTWQDLAKLLQSRVQIVRERSLEKSKISKGVPLPIIFMAFRRASNMLEGNPKGTEYEKLAIELLREFGEAKKAKPAKRSK